jgi:hypothetical protein
MTDVASHPHPFSKGNPAAKKYGSLGGSIAQANRVARAGVDPFTVGLLGPLLAYTTSDWMDRLGMTGPSWEAWRVVGKVVDGLGAALTPEEMVLFTAITGRTVVPSDLRELWALAGRGSGKTSFCALQGVKASCKAYPNVRGVPRVLLLAFVKEQAGVSFEMVEEMFDGDKELRKLITARTTTSLTLAHGVRVQTIASNWRSVRGYSVACALADEIAMWWNELTDSNPALEIIRALRPGLGKVPGSKLLAATTPWTEEGMVYDVHQAHYANNDSKYTLVVKASTLVLNSSFDEATIAIAEGEDPESAASEYGAVWRVAGGTLLRPMQYDACVDKGVFERACIHPLADDIYTVSVDLSGGTGQDSAALCVGHVEEADAGEPDVFVQDFLVECEPPFDPSVMVAQFAAVCKKYGVTEVIGDAFSAGFAASEFRWHKITYTISARKTNEVVLDTIAVVNTKRLRLLDVPKQRRQYLNLRRDYGTGGRPTILETRRHDDLAVVTSRGISSALDLGVVPETKRKVYFA